MFLRCRTRSYMILNCRVQPDSGHEYFSPSICFRMLWRLRLDWVGNWWLQMKQYEAGSFTSGPFSVLAAGSVFSGSLWDETAWTRSWEADSNFWLQIRQLKVVSGAPWDSFWPVTSNFLSLLDGVWCPAEVWLLVVSWAFSSDEWWRRLCLFKLLGPLN